MFTFLLVLQALVTLALIGVILMQKSEGGGLGMGGSPSGFLSARGAADFLSRATAILATTFVGLCVALAVLTSIGHRSSQVDATTAAAPPPVTGAPEQPVAPVGNAVPMAGGAPLAGGSPIAGQAPGDPLAAAAGAANSAAPAEKGVPLQR